MPHFESKYAEMTCYPGIPNDLLTRQQNEITRERVSCQQWVKGKNPKKKKALGLAPDGQGWSDHLKHRVFFWPN